MKKRPPPGIIDTISTHHSLGGRIGGKIDTHDDESDQLNRDDISCNGYQENLENALSLSGQLLIIINV